MRKFLKILLAVLLCTSAMCSTVVKADQITSKSKSNKAKIAVNSIQNKNSATTNNTHRAFSNEEVYLAAQLIYHEAHNQSYNGKVAVAEVVLNRIKSGLFPNTLHDVIMQSGQFANSRRIKNIKPDAQEIKIAEKVLNGNLRVLNDKDVLYFRNPEITSGVSAKTDKNWGSLDYVTYIGKHAFYAQNDEGTKNTTDHTPVIVVEKKAKNPEVPAKVTSKSDDKATSIDIKSNKAELETSEEAEILSDANVDEIFVEVVEDTEDSEEVEDVNAIESVDSDELLDDEFIVIADDLDDEDIDEEDPVAVARKRAKLDKEAEIKRIERENEIQNAANAAAQEQAVIIEQLEVDKVARANAEMAKATAAARAKINVN